MTECTHPLALIREKMQQHQLAAYLVTGSDPHGSEYPAEHWRSRLWLAGFSGSAGKIVVTAEQAGLWVDFRYHQQAEEELAGSTITLFPDGKAGVPSVSQWLAEQLPPSSTVGLDGSTMTAAEFARLSRMLQQSSLQLDGSSLLLSELWQQDRPPLPYTPVFEHALRYAGIPREAKLAQLREEMVKNGYSYLLMSALDGIAWLLNIRANDVPLLPVAVAHLLVGLKDCHLFIGAERVPDFLQGQLAQQSVIVHPYPQALSFLQELKGQVVFAGEETSCQLFHQALAKANTLRSGTDPVVRHKAIKNSTEMDNLRQVMVRDGVALIRFQYGLAEALARGEQGLTECSLVEQLTQCRQQQQDFQQNSFDPIVGYLANAAKPHYRSRPDTTLTIAPTGILLVDSGGQYLGGTTDITRSWTLGSATVEEKRDYTLVLKAHIALSCASFPVGAQGNQLDGIARHSMWQHGLDYQHGTGHGVGYFLSVHEAGVVISSFPRDAKFYPGMLVSNEPGVYRSGRYGIRIENLLLVRESELFDGFLQFETLSLCPYDRRLINPSLLTAEECSWVDSYHQRCVEQLSPWVKPAVRDWLRECCLPLDN